MLDPIHIRCVLDVEDQGMTKKLLHPPEREGILTDDQIAGFVLELTQRVVLDEVPPVQKHIGYEMYVRGTAYEFGGTIGDYERLNPGYRAWQDPRTGLTESDLRGTGV